MVNRSRNPFRSPLRFLGACPWVLALLLGMGAAQAGERPQDHPTDSFEDGLPKHYVAFGGRLSVVQDHAVHGKSSLRWDFGDDEKLEIRTGPLGDVNVWTGYGGYHRSTFVFSVYYPKLSQGKLSFELHAKRQLAGYFDVPMAHVGWQTLAYVYSSNSNITWVAPHLKGGIDKIVVRARGVEGRTYVCLDDLTYNQPRYFRRSAVTKPYVPAAPAFVDHPEPTPADLAKIKALGRKLRPDALKPEANGEDVWRAKCAKWEQLAKARSYNAECREVPVAKMEEAFDFLSAVSRDWCHCPYPAVRADLAGVFRKVNEWLQEQGLVANGALGPLETYGGRSYMDAVSRMRDAFADFPGGIGRTLDYVKWSYGYDEALFGNDTKVMSMDYFHNDAMRILRVAEMEPDPVRRWHHVDTFRRRLAKQLELSIKPDGSLFHHGFHYFGYGSYAMNSVSGLLATLSDVGLPVPKEGLDAVHLALDSMAWYSGRTILWSLHGRDASGRLEPPAGAYLQLASAYLPYQDSADRRAGLLSTFLRFRPDQARSSEMKGIMPAKCPEGFRTMPYAALALHRRDHWLVGIKGYSRYAAHGESYGKSNRFGLYMSHGQMEVLTHPVEAPTVLGSGTIPDRGYDWCAVDGVTAPYVEFAKVANGNGTRTLRSKETFVGGVSAGSDGVFAMRLDDASPSEIMADKKPKERPGNLKALKSWFCFGNRIVCLGTDISVKGFPYPIRTTLFQKLAEADRAGFFVDGAEWVTADAVKEKAFSAGRAMLRDPFGNAYAIPAARGLGVRCGLQESRDSNDKGVTRARYAKAWIEHGVAPDGAGYEYVVMVQPSAAQVAGFWDAPAHRVLSRDAKAHVVADAETASTGYAIFDPKTTLPREGVVLEVARPCLVIVSTRGPDITLAVADPDVRAEASTPVPLRVKLRGRYTCADPAVSNGYEGTTDVTTIVVPTLHGESHRYELKPSRGK